MHPYYNSKRSFGGVALYINKNIIFRTRNDLLLHHDHCEDVWIEINNSVGKNIIVVSIYRHPNADSNQLENFYIKLDSNLNRINNENNFL